MVQASRLFIFFLKEQARRLYHTLLIKIAGRDEATRAGVPRRLVLFGSLRLALDKFDVVEENLVLLFLLF